MRLAVAGATGTVGRHVARAAAERGHTVVPLGRSTGQDVIAGTGLEHPLVGADAVVDVTSIVTLSARSSRRFFETATRNLLRAERAAGVGHHVALSIVGIDAIDASYYAGKLAQERAVVVGGVPWTILRATQFHEFAEQMLTRASFGRRVLIPRTRTRPVAAREVAAALVTAAEAGPSGRVGDLVGPREEDLAALVRRLLTFDGDPRRVLDLPLPGTYGRGLRSGEITRGQNATVATTTFEQWLQSEDHVRLVPASRD
jgi:uncharacterized protein YbjT (DUF2867 family)